MRRLYMIMLGVAAGVAVSVTAGGSAYAGEAVTTSISPAVHVPGGVDYQDDLTTGCGSHRIQPNSTAP